MPDIPRAQLEYYKIRTVEQVAPANNWWSYRQWFKEGWGLSIFIISLVITFIGARNMYEHYFWFWVWCAIAFTSLGMTILFFLSSVLEKAPGRWQPYRPIDCYLRYPEHSAQMRALIEQLRKENPSAEFEAEVLEREHEFYGAVLYIFIDCHPAPPELRTDAGSSDDMKERVPIKVFSSLGEPVEDWFLVLETRS